MTNIELQTLTAVKEAARCYLRENEDKKWEQRRYKTAAAILSGLVSKYGMADKQTLVESSVTLANMLIKELITSK